MVDRNLTIKALKKELEILKAEKTRLAEEVGGLHAARSDLEILQRKVDSLNKEVDAEREFGVAMKAQVDMPTRHLEDAKTVGLVVVELYVGALEQFGGSTSSLSSLDEGQLPQAS